MLQVSRHVQCIRIARTGIGHGSAAQEEVPETGTLLLLHEQQPKRWRTWAATTPAAPATAACSLFMAPTHALQPCNHICNHVRALVAAQLPLAYLHWAVRSSGAPSTYYSQLLFTMGSSAQQPASLITCKLAQPHTPLNPTPIPATCQPQRAPTHASHRLEVFACAMPRRLDELRKVERPHA